MLDGNDKLRFEEMHTTIVRIMNLVKEDFSKPSTTQKIRNRTVSYVKWFEKKYEYKFRAKSNRLVIKRGEVYYCDFGDNIGSEQNKIRPAIILQNDVGNLHSTTTIVAPITDEPKPELPTHVDIKLLKPNTAVRGEILIEQLRCVSKNRLLNKLDVIDPASEAWDYMEAAINTELGMSKKD